MILVTGGSGFIGSHLVDKLKQEDFDVRVFDVNKPLREDVDWFKGDLLKETDLLRACKDIEVVFHLAAVSDVNMALANPKLCVEVNEIGTLHLLNAARACEIERIILASTTWVYGRATQKVTEESPIPPPEHLYTKTKIGQEHLLTAWNEHYKLPYTILRYDIPYGLRMRSNLVIAVFVRKVKKKEIITIFGDGMQGRCFIHVEDLASGNVASLNTKAKNQIINIAGSEFITINHIVEEIKNFFGDVIVEYKPKRSGDYRGTTINISKAEKFLNWRPKIRFSVGLQEYMKSGTTME